MIDWETKTMPQITDPMGWKYPAPQKDEPGLKYDAGKARMDLLPMDALIKVGLVLDYGANKYAARNWERGMSWGRLMGAAMRHIGQWMLGNEVDEESGHNHLDHAITCLLMARASQLRKIGTDDRKVTP